MPNIDRDFPASALYSDHYAGVKPKPEKPTPKIKRVRMPDGKWKNLVVGPIDDTNEDLAKQNMRDLGITVTLPASSTGKDVAKTESLQSMGMLPVTTAPKQEPAPAPTPERATPTSPDTKRTKPKKQKVKGRVENQDDFFDIVPESPYAKVPEGYKPQQINLEETIDRWHGMFGSKNDHDRKRLLSSDASREWRQLKKALGLTQKHFTEHMRLKAAEAIQRLDDAGVLSMLYKHMTSAEQQRMIAILEKFDHDHRQPWHDWDSSEGFTIYPSAKSMQQDRS